LSVGGRASRFRRITRLKAVDPPSGPKGEEERKEPAGEAGPPPETAPGARGGDVVRIGRARGGRREWNLWELEELARAGASRNPERSQEWAYLFVHLRQFAEPDGRLPPEFDGLVRESFGELLEASGRA
jgi:hypothetical protein